MADGSAPQLPLWQSPPTPPPYPSILRCKRGALLNRPDVVAARAKYDAALAEYQLALDEWDRRLSIETVPAPRERKGRASRARPRVQREARPDAPRRVAEVLPLIRAAVRRQPVYLRRAAGLDADDVVNAVVAKLLERPDILDAPAVSLEATIGAVVKFETFNAQVKCKPKRERAMPVDDNGVSALDIAADTSTAAADALLEERQWNAAAAPAIRRKRAELAAQHGAPGMSWTENKQIGIALDTLDRALEHLDSSHRPARLRAARLCSPETLTRWLRDGVDRG